MKTIGMIGGTSWESSVEYYRWTNLLVNERLGGLASAKSLLLSVNFAELSDRMQVDEWQAIAQEMQRAAQSLEAGGADCILLCSNTLHRVPEDVAAAVSIPLLHIADATADAAALAGLSALGLLGTRFVMEGEFYRSRLGARHVLSVEVPKSADRDFTHRVIFEELCRGILREETRAEFRRIVKDLVDCGAQGIILGCTELSLLLSESDSSVPLLDTTRIHAEAAVDFILAG